MADEQKQSDAGPRVLRVAEARMRGDGRERIFSVVLDRVAEDLAIVAEAEDPKTHLRIPTAGSPHPLCPELAARPPEIHCPGVIHKGGAFIGPAPFYNIRVRYVAAARTGPEDAETRRRGDAETQTTPEDPGTAEAGPGGGG